MFLAGGANGGISKPEAWDELRATSDGKIGFAVYVDAMNELPTSWKQWDCHAQITGAWGHFNLVIIELALYKVALKRFPNAAWFVFVSGDSVPVKSAETFITPPFNESCVGFWPVWELEPDVHEHSQWKAMRRHDAQLVVQHCTSEYMHAAKIKHDALRTRHGCCGIPAPGEKHE